MKVIYSNDRKQNITRERNAQEERFDQTVPERERREITSSSSGPGSDVVISKTSLHLTPGRKSEYNKENNTV